MDIDFNRLKIIFEKAPVGIFQTTYKGQFVDLNAELVHIFGYDSVEDVKNHIRNLGTDLFAIPGERDHVLREITGKDEISSFEVKYKKKNKEVIDARLSIRPYFNTVTNELNFIGTVEDITEKKKLREQAQVIEKRYRALFENSHDAILIYQQNQILECNQKAIEMFKIPPGMENSFYLKDIFPEKQPDGQDSLLKSQQIIERVMAGASLTFEWLHQKFNGEIFFTEVSLNKLEIGLEGCFQTIVRDITDRKATEDALLKSEERFKILSSFSDEGLMIHEKGMIIDTNLAFAKLVGYANPEDLIGKNGLELIPFTEASRKMILEHLQSESTEAYDIELLDAQGRIIPVETKGKKIVYKGRQARIVFMREISRRKNAENELKASESKYRYLLDHMNEVVMMVDNDDRVLFVNNQFTQTLGYTYDEIVGKIGYTILLNPDEHNMIIEANRKRIRKQISQYEIAFKSKNGQKIDFIVSGAPIIDSSGKTIGSIGTMTDISERKKAEENLRLSESKFRLLFENMSNGFVLHEILVDDDNQPVDIRILEINDIAARNYGLSRPEVQNKTLKELKFSFNPRDHSETIQVAFSGESLRFDRYYENSDKYFRVYMYSPQKYCTAIILEDITQQKKAEIARHEMEEKYSRIVNTAHEGIQVVDKNFILTFVNAQMASMLGYTPEEMLYKPLRYFVHEDDLKDHLSKADNRKSGVTERFERRFNKKDGTTLWASISSTPIIDSVNGFQGSFAMVTDITEHHAMEIALKQREELFRNLIDLAPYPIVLNEFDGRYIIVNRAFTRDTGFEAHEVIGRKSEDFGLLVNPEHEHIIHDVVLKNTQIENLETQVTVKNGKVTHVLYSAKIITMENRPVLLSSSIDITEMVKIQKELELHKNNLERLVKERTEEIETLNEELIAANEELTSTNEELYQNNEELNAVNEALASQKKTLQDTLETLKLTQAQLVQSEKMASIGILTAGIAHEINNPINFISSGITGLEIVINDILKILQEYSLSCPDVPNCSRKATGGKEYQNQQIEKLLENISILIPSIRTGVERTTNIIKGLRTFSRLDNETLTKANIHELIDSAIVILTNKYKERIVIEKHYSDLDLIYCYPGKLSQVFLNILMNAIQAIVHKGTITITTRKRLHSNQIEISIKDTGQGMTKEIQKKIFDPFYTTKPVGEGTGMGLPIVHGIIKDHKGEIIVNSIIDQGTEFKIRLPYNL